MAGILLTLPYYCDFKVEVRQEKPDWMKLYYYTDGDGVKLARWFDDISSAITFVRNRFDNIQSDHDRYDSWLFSQEFDLNLGKNHGDRLNEEKRQTLLALIQLERLI